MDPIIAILLGVIAIVAASVLAPKVRVAGPLILVVLGIGVSLLPFVPEIEVDPEFILVGVLPPLLYAAAVRLPAIEFRRDFRPIAGLSVVLVLLSSVVLGLFFYALIPGIDFLLAIALGAILSPTDAVATSIVKRLGISRRIVTILEGESLLNDATSLVVLRVMIASSAVVAADSDGRQPNLFVAFAWGVLVAVVLGWLVGYLNLRLRAHVHQPAANSALGFIVPFVAYLPTEQLGGSGLVAAVVAGIVTGQGAARRFTPEQRLSDEANWRTIELLLEGGVFLVMGLELKEIVDENYAAHGGLGRAAVLAATALGIILVVRIGWVSFLVWLQSRRAREQRRRRLDEIGARLDEIETGPSTRRRTGPDAVGRAVVARVGRIARMREVVARRLADLDYYQASPLGWRQGAVLVWAGLRGVVTLAAAQTLPRETPERALLVLVAFLVAVGSLVIQGLTLPWLVRRLGLRSAGGDTISADEQTQIDDELRSAAVTALADPALRRRDGRPFPDELVHATSGRLTDPPDDDTSVAARDRLELRLRVIEAMRDRLLELSSGGSYSTPALRHMLAELDADQLSVELRLEDEDRD
ncbi:sodium:proton antiporter [Microbacterium awajiense]|uniref:Sodium:proton antiporter n=1 Tax=Microbacterium awajiense TaxID=415214 RepID=A0ABP7AN06_9MICO